MSVSRVYSDSNLTSDQAKHVLVTLLQNAHAGEKAAANAYWGHGRSLFVRDPIEREEILRIEKEELHHRQRIFQMLVVCGAKPNPFKEKLMNTIGAVIGFLCLFGGWFIPMYGAGKLESENMVEYETAARLAYICGLSEIIEELLQFAEVEWDHELYFRQKAESHWASGFFPKLIPPAERNLIRSEYSKFIRQREGKND